MQATHKATAQLKGFGQVIGITSMSPSPSYGSTGLFVDLVQQKLAALHIYIPQTGRLGQRHRVGDQRLSPPAEPRLLDSARPGRRSTTCWPARAASRSATPTQGRHVEGNLGKQLAALIVGSKVYWIFPISSGKPSTPTILGSFQIYSRVPGYLPDGMYYSDFFIRRVRAARL